MDNYNNILDSTIEYGNIVYGGINTQIPQLQLQQQQQQQHPQQNISDDTTTVLLQTSDDVKVLSYETRQTIITNNLQPQIQYEHQIQHQLSHDGVVVIENVPNVTILNQDTNQHFHPEIQEAQETELSSITTNGEDNLPVQQLQHVDENNQIDYLQCDDEQKLDPMETDADVDCNLMPTTTEAIPEISIEMVEEDSKNIAENHADEINNDQTKIETENILDENIKTENIEPEVPVPTKKEKKEDEIDPNQCRICLSKENLIDIFNFEDSLRLCDKIMQLCPSVRIILKDFLPNQICNNCVENLKVAYEFKLLCEKTDNELRKKLKRSKNKIRRPTEFILIDCDEFSESNTDDDIKNPDDDEFHISESMSEQDSSDSSFSVGKKKKVTRPRRRAPRKRTSTSGKKRSRRPTRKTTSSTTTATRTTTPTSSSITKITNDQITQSKRPRQQEIVLIKAEDSDTDIKPQSRSTSKNPKRIKKNSESKSIDYQSDDDTSFLNNKNNGSKQRSHQCPFCDKICSSYNSLREHKKDHVGEKPFTCHICNKAFKQTASLTAHIQKHKDDDNLTCGKCKKLFNTKNELRKHLQNVFCDEPTSFECRKCKRGFPSLIRLEKHIEKCSGFDPVGTKKRNDSDLTQTVGKDLFKCVAPMTTTYWSDSFSE